MQAHMHPEDQAFSCLLMPCKAAGAGVWCGRPPHTRKPHGSPTQARKPHGSSPTPACQRPQAAPECEGQDGQAADGGDDEVAVGPPAVPKGVLQQRREAVACDGKDGMHVCVCNN